MVKVTVKMVNGLGFAMAILSIIPLICHGVILVYYFMENIDFDDALELPVFLSTEMTFCFLYLLAGIITVCGASKNKKARAALLALSIILFVLSSVMLLSINWSYSSTSKEKQWLNKLRLGTSIWIPATSFIFVIVGGVFMQGAWADDTSKKDDDEANDPEDPKKNSWKPEAAVLNKRRALRF